jgi:hypothetical protein
MPLAVAYIGAAFAASSTQRATNVELLKLATGILAADTSHATRGLRRYGVEVLKKYSEVPISAELEAALIDSLRLPPVSVSEGGTATALRAGTALLQACVAGACGTARVTVVDTPQLSRSPQVQWKILR